ncbi:MAG: GNAT family N-acetyltransferase [Bacteroidales bacterium]|jgi:ribosomal protein S18 acetylase RimI-like enzyme|nr:GNAT family N-acetyltransferase [Bacteroidales bacterium]
MMRIRKAAADDSNDIIDFQKKMAWETEEYLLDDTKVTPGVMAVFENPGHGQYWVAEDEGKVVASLLITYEWSDWRNANVWWFQSVYVLPEYRRSGIFRSMYLKIKEEGERQGIAGLRLYVETNNERARKTYEALGMQSEHYTMYEWLKN